MTAFLNLTSPVRCLFLLWGLLNCFAAIVCMVYGLRQKQRRYALSALPCFGASFFLWEIMTDVANFYLREPHNAFCLRCAEMPWLLFAGVLLLCMAVSAGILRCSLRYHKSHITPDSIRICADLMPCGICYWQDGGKVIFANTCMTELCFALLGTALQNGEELSAAVSEPILPIGKQVWSFTSRTVQLKGAPLHELIAADITELYAKTAKLKAENEEIARYNEALRTYHLHIDETVRQREILQAKVNIHDEMNKLMLTTVAAGSEGGGSLDDAFALWQSNALLLCREAANEDGGSVENLERIAAALKIKLIWHHPLPDGMEKKQRSLFFSAAQEAIANAFKHAGVRTLTIDCIPTADGVLCEFGNKGRLPDSPVSFTGGLGNLKSLAEWQGAEVFVSVSDRFTLTLFLPKEPKNLPFGRCPSGS